MSEDAYLMIINNTKYQWKKDKEKSNQIDLWSFPDTIKPKSKECVYIKWNENLDIKEETIEEVSYFIMDNENSIFKIELKNKKIFINISEVDRKKRIKIKKVKYNKKSKDRPKNILVTYKHYSIDLNGEKIIQSEEKEEVCNEFKKENTWSNTTLTVTSIENLYLNDSHKWTKCMIKLQGEKNKTTNYKITVLVDGKIKEPFIDGVLESDESKAFVYDINQKVAVLVVGYIFNKNIGGAGVTIDLVGYYN